MLIIEEARDRAAWDDFLSRQRYRPFLQSWTMGEVYRDIGEEPIRLVVKEGETIVGICQAMLVNAKRGRHLAVPYGPILSCELLAVSYEQIWNALKKVAIDHCCTFIRVSPFIPTVQSSSLIAHSSSLIAHSSSLIAHSSCLPSPLHLLAEHIWYLPLKNPDPWSRNPQPVTSNSPVTEEQLLMAMRKTTRNLIRRAEKDGVTVEDSKDPVHDLEHFLTLHDETRKRHGFTPYTNAFFKAQIAHFAPRNECTLYLARYQGNVIASSIHMHAFGETSYHHGASSHAHSKIPASYLLQWTAIRDALGRRDRVYNFWGIAPMSYEHLSPQSSKLKAQSSRHPFAGVTLFKTGFGGQLLNLIHCQDIPISKKYYLTWGFEMVRKWKRGF